MSKLFVNEIHSKTGTSHALDIDSDGNVEFKGVVNYGKPIGFAVNKSGNQSITVTNTKISGWETDSYMYGGFNTDGSGGSMINTTSGVVTIPATGYYSFVFNTRVDSFAGTYIYFDLIKTDSSGTHNSTITNRAGRSLESATASDYTSMQIQGTRYFEKDDYFAVFFSNSGDNSVTIDGDTYFSMFKVG